MTKYILHGGASKKDTENNRNFFKEICKDLPNSSTILVVCYMMEGKDWNEVLETDKKRFASAAPGKNLNIILADTNTDIFIKQIKKADAIYMHGGNTNILKKYLIKIPDLENIWKDKTIAGTSAGALVLSKYWYENDDDSYNIGLGILPFKLFCHYSNKNSDELSKLNDFGDHSKTQTLEEEQYLIYEN